MVLLATLSLLAIGTKGVAEAPNIPYAQKTFEEQVQETFKDDYQIMMAIFKAEGGIDKNGKPKLEAKNYNCFYYNEKGKRYSTYCKKEDRQKAWSVDCGIAQVNVKGQICPTRLVTIEGNIESAKKIKDEQGFEAWVVYKTGKYKKYL